jgi:transcriptional regulator with XRE-family HTH domain
VPTSPTPPIPLDTVAPVCGAIADVIREQREARGLSMYELAKRAGISRGTVGLVEARRSVPTFDMGARICAGLGIKLSELVGQAERRC